MHGWRSSAVFQTGARERMICAYAHREANLVRASMPYGPPDGYSHNRVVPRQLDVLGPALAEP
jgi:hypothetical protein